MSKLTFNELKRKALEKYFGRMNERQKEAVFAVDGPVLVLAGAGSGKTTVIVNRIANMINFGNAYNDDSYQGNDADCALLEQYIDGGEITKEQLRDAVAVSAVKPWHILAITFTNKAAGELRERIMSMLGDDGEGLQAATFHSACVRILRRDIDKLGYQSSFTIYDSDDSQRIIKQCMNELEISEKQLSPKSVMSEIGFAKDRLTEPEEMLSEASGDYRKMLVAKIYKLYQKKLFSANAVDFDDIIKLTVKLLTDFPETLEYYQNRYKYIMVDEYQDTNKAQFRLVSLLSAKHNNICVVGDDDQSIYKFRGATIENILSFEQQFAGSRVIRLEQNYRSTQTILDAANSVIKNNASRKEKQLWTELGQGDKIYWYKAQNERDEAQFVAEKIQENVKTGGKFSDNAVLYRMNAQSNLVEQALVKSGIPYRVYGGMRFYDRKEIKDITSYMAVINNNNDALRMRRIINEPKRGIGDSTLALLSDITNDLGLNMLEAMRNSDDYPMLAKKSAPLKKTAAMFDKLIESTETKPLDEFFDDLLSKTGYLDYIRSMGDEGITRLENINELKSTVIAYMNDAEEPSLNGFLEEIALYTDLDKMDAGTDAVTMMTVHSAKGLEFTNVFAIGMEDGIFPSGRCLDSDEELEEERRLAYVAITRAKKNLFVSSASQRMLFGSTQRNFTSRFIKEIDKSLIEKHDNTIIDNTDKPPVNHEVKSMSLQQQLSRNKKKAAPAVSGDEYSVGEKVKHNIFGEGTILSVKKMASDAMLEIAFEKVGTKKIMANFAKLQKL
ncbi:MAG: UvrD-helicase domain-containing protein [Oscillospiraceae bacterium]|nr:UvrD-helicase domain-containing protein [Oscillospiraceae bacterium]